LDFVKFGIIGAGGAWAFHSAGCKDSTVVKFVAVYDINTANAVKMAKRYRINEMTAYSDLNEFLNSDIDAVLIMVPHVYHESLVIAAASAGKHVLCEKPMATTLEGCDQMINATKNAGVKLMIAENHRFLPAHQYIHDAIQQNLIGDIILVRAYEGVNEIPGLSQPDFWKGDPIKAGGGALMDMGAHKFATLEWILDDQVESVSATLAKQCINLPEKAEDNALAIARFKKGTIAEVVVSFTQITMPYNSLEIHGTKGSILENHNWEHPVRINSIDSKLVDNPNTWFEPEIEHGIFPLYYNISARCEDEYFAKCIIDDKDPEFTPQQARSAIADILMGYLSARTGKTATYDDLMEIYQSQGTTSILENLNNFVPINQNLSKVLRMQPIGFDKQRAQQILEKHDIDALVVTSPVNVFYFSGLPTQHVSPNPILYVLNNQYPNAVIIRKDGEISLFYWELFQSVEKFSWAADHVGILSPKDTARQIVSKLKKWGFEGKNIAVESSAPKFLTDYLPRKLPDSSIIDGDRAILEMRLIKSEEEIARIQKALMIAEQAIMACIDKAQEGMTDNDFLKIARSTIVESGAEGWDHLTLSIGNSDPEAPGTGTVLNQGDIARFDFGAVWQGYVSDISRHLVLGEAPEEAKVIIDRLIQVQEFCEEQIKPGVNMKQISIDANAFYNTLNPNGSTLVTAHSIGLETEEVHFFGPIQVLDLPFEENMVFEIELWEKFQNSLIGVEDCYVVRSDGCKRLSTLDKHIFIR